MTPARRLAAVLWLALLCWAAAILRLSSLSPDELPDAAFLFGDKVNHALAFIVGGWLAATALRVSRPYTPQASVFVIAVVMVAAFGAVDETVQTFTPGRTGADVRDWTADVLGATIGALVSLLGSRVRLGFGRRTAARPPRSPMKPTAIALTGAAIAVGTAALAVPARAVEPDISGTYTFQAEDGESATWTLTPCSADDDMCLRVSESGNAKRIPWSGDAHYAVGSWILFVQQPDAILCPDGSSVAGLNTYSWDAVALSGSASIITKGACGAKPGSLSIPFTLTRIGPAPGAPALPPPAPAPAEAPAVPPPAPVDAPAAPPPPDTPPPAASPAGVPQTADAPLSAESPVEPPAPTVEPPPAPAA